MVKGFSGLSGSFIVSDSLACWCHTLY